MFCLPSIYECATALEQCLGQRCGKALLKSSGTPFTKRATIHSSGRWVAVLMLLAACAAPARSQDDASETPLATKERIIHDRVLQLEDQMYRLIEQLRESEPEKARRMERVLARMGELGIRRQLETVIEVLNEDRLDEAITEQNRLLENLSTLLTLLIDFAPWRTWLISSTASAETPAAQPSAKSIADRTRSSSK